ncbi:MAG: hypothetical protein LUC90_08515 [Lachnospiraceae bacterium]|nr:hypothetical protein [Lachnospiraceae bacterium]
MEEKDGTQKWKYTVSPIYYVEDPQQKISPIEELNELVCPLYYMDGRDGRDLRRSTSSPKEVTETKNVIQEGEIVREAYTPHNPGKNISQPTFEKQEPIANYQVRPLLIKQAVDYKGNMVAGKSVVEAEIIMVLVRIWVGGLISGFQKYQYSMP